MSDAPVPACTCPTWARGHWSACPTHGTPGDSPFTPEALADAGRLQRAMRDRRPLTTSLPADLDPNPWERRAQDPVGPVVEFLRISHVAQGVGGPRLVAEELNRAGCYVEQRDLSSVYIVDVGKVVRHGLGSGLDSDRVRIMRELGAVLRPFCPEAADYLETWETK